MKPGSVRLVHHSLQMRFACAVASVLALVVALVFAQSAHASLVDDLAHNEAESLAYIQEHGVESLADWSEQKWGSNVGNAALTAQADLPEKYDLRNVNGKNYVTPVKLQNPWGSCWSFGAIAAVETSILSELGLSYSEFKLDLSERQLAWFSGTKLPDAETMKKIPAQASYASQAGEGITSLKLEDNPFASPLNTGGTPFYATTLFAAGIGPLDESEAPYKNDENMAVINIREPQGLLYAGETSSSLKNSDGTQTTQPVEYFNSVIMHKSSTDPTLVAGDFKRADATTTDKATLTEYASAPLFDDTGHLIGTDGYSASTYTWGLPEDERLYLNFELEESKSLPSPAGADENGKYVYNAAGTAAIKQEILAGRGVHIEFCADQSQPNAAGQADFINQNTWAHYTYDTSGQGNKVTLNHDVCIVGWDDNYSASNFNTGDYVGTDASGATYTVNKNPSHDGAWIVKNSWGAATEEFPNRGDWGIKDADGKSTGYFYLSYYDMSITRPTSYNFYPESITGTRDSIFINQYDFMPAYDVFAMSSGEQYSVANVFTAEDDQVVRTLSVETVEPNTHAKLELYRLNSDAATPVDGELIETLEADYAYGGYHRLQTQQKHFMEKDQKFAVVATLTSTDSAGKAVYQIPMHRSFSKAMAEKTGSPLKIYATGVINQGESFALDGGAWVDWTEELAEIRKMDSGTASYEYDNFALKAFADEVDPFTIEKKILNPQDVYHPGDVIQYQLIVHNESKTQAIENIVVTDSLGDLGDAGKIDIIDPGEEAKIEYSYTVTAADAARGSVTNEAEASVTGFEGMSAKVSMKAICAEKATLSIHRLYNPNSGEHFYTKATPEYNMLIDLGWNDEGFGWTAPEESNTPVYRLYNVYGGEHHFTTSVTERDFLVGIGWNDEGIGWSSDDAETTPLHRDYNPNAFANNHNYTASTVEHEYLNSIGWRDEGIGWYGL